MNRKINGIVARKRLPEQECEAWIDHVQLLLRYGQFPEFGDVGAFRRNLEKSACSRTDEPRITK